MTYDYDIVNAFTTESLQGNPVAVVWSSNSLTVAEMQGIAAQFHLSETTFVRARSMGGLYDVRVFTPVNELTFAGHPMLGTAAAISEKYGTEKFTICTRKYRVVAEVEQSAPLVRHVVLRFPEPALIVAGDFPKILGALGLTQTRFPVAVYDAGARHALVAISDAAELRELSPDQRALSEFSDLAINCFVANGNEIENRMFSPAYGVLEDAATGSVVNAIASFLRMHGQIEEEQEIAVTQGICVGRISHMYGRISRVVSSDLSACLSGDTTEFARGRINSFTHQSRS